MLSSGASEQNPNSTFMPLSNRVLVQRARPEHEQLLRQQPVATSDQVRFSLPP